ncbi:coiled-coil-helix-coiled-coil-helix domain-containing protein 7 isoform X2 [Globicephala melas]|uniref:coiled-coil-helix-coiled-coil-helix domain-containing protein 7 isoform X2 n=2 Tax=Globicephala melas TaxID=9731 RepID=UPI00122FABDC|nr:coiled-coil-helix-coiled-coil-helix domain-containing protein 7 isoform X2 [Globicephala melas]
MPSPAPSSLRFPLPLLFWAPSKVKVGARKKTGRMPVVAGRLRDPDINPCLLESDASTRCMDEYNYDKERCSTHFLKYKNCRKFWNSIMIQRRRDGVKPSMPAAAERDIILQAMGKMPY